MTKIQKIIFSSLVTLQVVIALLFCFSGRGLVDLWRIKGEMDRLVQDNILLEKKSVDLARRVRRLMGDRKYIESMVRKEFGMIAEDELVFQFDDTVEGKP